MKITKFVHSCILVEHDDKVVLFDPGEFSTEALNSHDIATLDEIYITHEHGDHFVPENIAELIGKFPDVKVITTNSIASKLKEVGIEAAVEASTDSSFFHSPHEGHPPMFNPPEEVGVHYQSKFTHPGDSHSFTETMEILALPIAAPWGSTDRAVQLALELHPKFIVPIHDWHWKDEVREEMYERLEKLFANEGITFFKMKTGKPVTIDM